MMDMKDLGLFSGTIEMDTKKLQMQLNAIKKAATILGDELAGIDKVHEDPEPVKDPRTWIKENDLVLICKAGDGRGESPELVGLYGRVIAVYNNDVVAVCVREDNEYFPSREVKMYTKQLKVVK